MSFQRAHYKCARLCRKIYDIPPNSRYVKLPNKKALVIIEGTDDLSNWNDNVKFMFRNRLDIHRGFYRYAKQIMNKHDLQSNCKDSDHVTFTGHSLGAAAALVSVYLLSKDLKEIPNIDLVLFGCPKIGGDTIVESIEALENVSIFNYKFKNDIVCDLPIGCGYQELEHIHIQPTNGIPSIHDHKIDNYIEALSHLNNRREIKSSPK